MCVYVDYLSDQFALPVHAEIVSTLCTSDSDSAAEAVRLHKKTSCREKEECVKPQKGQHVAVVWSPIPICLVSTLKRLFRKPFSLLDGTTVPVRCWNVWTDS